MSVDRSSFSSEEEQKSLQAYGQAQYRFGHYEEALDAFSKALRIGKGDLLGLLDNRAATFCALNNLDSALRDGKRMIKSNKRDARGYLRTAKVLQLQKKLDGALRLYNYALQTLGPDDPARQQVEMLSAKLQKALAPPTRLDPFAILPPEIATMILEYMDMTSMLRIIQVSKSWERVGASVRGPWSHLDLSMARRSVPLRSVRTYVLRALPAVKEVTLARYTPTQILKVIALLAKCPKLMHLNLIKMDFGAQYDVSSLYLLSQLKTLDIDDSIVMLHSQFCSILKHLPNLERTTLCVRPDLQTPVKLPFTPRLKRLGLKSYLYMSYFLYNETASLQMPNLEHMSLLCAAKEPPNRTPRLDLKDFRHLRTLILEGLSLMEYPVLPDSLEKLALGSASVSPMNQGNRQAGIPNLNHLELNHMRSTTLNTLNHFLSPPRPALMSLNIKHCSPIAGDDLVQLMVDGHFKSVTHLNIAGTRAVDDAVVDTIIATMPNLKMLDLSQTEVTGLSVKSLADTENLQLEKLLVLGLAIPINRDAIEYGRNRGIQIPLPFPSV